MSGHLPLCCVAGSVIFQGKLLLHSAPSLWPAIWLGLPCRVLAYLSCACNFSVASLLCLLYASINNDGGLAKVSPLPSPPRLIQKYSFEIR